MIELAAIDQALDAIEATGSPTREQILTIERFILDGPQIETPTTHYFSPGIYAREMFIPAGTVLTGAVHKTKHLVRFEGDITVLTDGGIKRLTGRHTFVSKPGAKRVGYAHADTWCTGFFATVKTDVTELEDDLVEDAHLLQSRVFALAESKLKRLEA